MKKNNVIGLWLLSIVAATIFFWPANPFDRSAIRINIPEGASAGSVQSILKAERILPAGSFFRVIVRLLRQENGIQAGTYLFSPSDPLYMIIGKLTKGQTIPPDEIRVSFPEGASIYKMGKALDAAGYKKWQKFQGLVHEGITAQLRERHRAIFRYIPSESLEGYLFPDTYNFFIDASVEAVAEAMIRRFEKVVMPFWEKAKKDTKYSLHEILTMASIIEKEAKVPGERTVISSVFYNRLKIGMPLAADPTIKYALERPSKRVYLDQLSVNSPYNTYKRRGLPPGPICNPGLESIKAAVYPARSEYLYFVAKPDGSHYFSKSWDEHQKARQKVSTPTR